MSVFVYLDLSFSWSLHTWVPILITGSRCSAVTMILWPTLLQPNPFLTVLVDPNGPTPGGQWWGDVLPWHRYRLHWQALASVAGLLLLGAFRETPHGSLGKPITTQQTLWQTLSNKRGDDVWCGLASKELSSLFSFNKKNWWNEKDQIKRKKEISCVQKLGYLSPWLKKCNVVFLTELF